MNSDLKWRSLGVVLGASGALIGVTGTSLARHSFVKESLVFSKASRWMAGVTLSIVLSPVISGVSLLFCPASIVASFGAFAVLFNVFVASYILQEKPTASDIWGSVLVFLGITLMVATSRTSSFNDPFGNFINTLRSPSAFIYFATVISIFLFCIVVQILAKCQKGPASSRSLLRPLVLETQPGTRECRTLRKFCLAISAGLCSCNTTLMGKSLVLAVVTTSHQRSILDLASQPINQTLQVLLCWPFVGCCIAFALLGITDLAILNASLQNLEVLYFVPVRNATIVICGNIGGMALFQEKHSNTFSFCFGLLATIGGMFALTLPQRTVKSQPELHTAEFA